MSAAMQHFNYWTDSCRYSSAINVCVRVFSISTIHRGVSVRDTEWMPSISSQSSNSFQRSGIQTAENTRRRLLNSLPIITNKWQHSGRYTERPTVKVPAQTVSNGMLDGGTTCISCELAYSELYMLNSRHSSTTHSCQNKNLLWEVKQLSPRVRRLPSLLSHSRMICSQTCFAQCKDGVSERNLQ